MPIESAYKHSGWLRRCIDLRADAFAGIPFTIRRASNGKVLYDSTDFNPLPPNLEWLADFQELARLTEIAIVMYGKAYWKPLFESGRPTGFQWINPLMIEEEYSTADGTIIRYKRKLRNPHTGMMTDTYLGVDEVVAFYQRHPLTEIGPPESSIADGVRINADVLYSLDKFLDSYMDRGLLPATILGLPANTPPESRKQFQAWWERLFRGKNNAGRQHVVNADSVTVHTIGNGIKDLSSSAVVQEQREAIAATLGVPMSHLLSSAANRATAFQEDENLYTKGIIPNAKRRVMVYNKQIFAPLGLYFRYEFNRIEALMRADLDSARSLDKIVPNILTPNEGRARLGYERVDGGDELQQAVPHVAGAVPPEVDDEDVDPMDNKALADIQKWRFKVQNKGASVPFESDTIPPWAQKTIRRRLDAGEGDEAFDPPYFDL